MNVKRAPSPTFEGFLTTLCTASCRLLLLQTFFLVALATGRVVIVAAWVLESYSPQHAQLASVAAYTSTPFLHIILALLFSK